MSVLHHAAQSGNVDLVKFIVTKGADPSATDNYGQTPAPSIQACIDDENYLNFKEIHSFLSSAAWNPNRYADSNLVQRSFSSNKRLNAFSVQKTPSEFRPSGWHEISNATGSRDFAVVIGNDQYGSFPSLQTAVNDAQAVAHMLQDSYNFNSQLIINGSRLEILQTFDLLGSVLAPSSNLLIYYAGHGYYDRTADRGYWLPVDAQPDTTANWISNADITDKLKTIDARHVMVVADSCYSGALTRGLKVTMRDPDYYQKTMAMRSRTALTSGGLEPVADSGGANHSIFAQAFINALEQNSDEMDGTELFTQPRRPVMLNSDQTPEYSDIRKAGHEGGDFLFIRR